MPAIRKEGIGVKELLDKVVEKIPSPKDLYSSDKLSALIYDSYFDPYLGVVLSVRIMNGKVKVGDSIKMMKTGATYEVVSLGITTPRRSRFFNGLNKKH